MNHICSKKALKKQGIDFPNTCYLFRLKNSVNHELIVLCVDCNEALFRVKRVHP